MIFRRFTEKSCALEGYIEVLYRQFPDHFPATVLKTETSKPWTPSDDTQTLDAREMTLRRTNGRFKMMIRIDSAVTNMEFMIINPLL